MYRKVLSGILACAGLCGVSQAGDVPDVKTGLWETKTTTSDASKPIQMETMCTSTALLQTLYDSRLKNSDMPCKQLNVTRSGNTISDQMECKFGDKVIKTKSVTVVTGDTAVHSEIHQDGKSTIVVSDSRYLHACPPGMQLGDFVGADGTKFNILHPEHARASAKSP